MLNELIRSQDWQWPAVAQCIFKVKIQNFSKNTCHTRLGKYRMVTCMCLQSWPRAGKEIRRQVMGHLRGTLMAVCSTPSSPLTAELVATLEKFRLTANKKCLLLKHFAIGAHNFLKISGIRTWYNEKWGGCGWVLAFCVISPSLKPANFTRTGLDLF